VHLDERLLAERRLQLVGAFGETPLVDEQWVGEQRELTVGERLVGGCGGRRGSSPALVRRQQAPELLLQLLEGLPPQVAAPSPARGR
jgi:hypothetical protein